MYGLERLDLRKTPEGEDWNGQILEKGEWVEFIRWNTRDPTQAGWVEVKGTKGKQGE